MYNNTCTHVAYVHVCTRYCTFHPSAYIFGCTLTPFIHIPTLACSRLKKVPHLFIESFQSLSFLRFHCWELGRANSIDFGRKEERSPPSTNQTPETRGRKGRGSTTFDLICNILFLILLFSPEHIEMMEYTSWYIRTRLYTPFIDVHLIPIRSGVCECEFPHIPVDPMCVRESELSLLLISIQPESTVSSLGLHFSLFT